MYSSVDFSLLYDELKISSWIGLETDCLSTDFVIENKFSIDRLSEQILDFNQNFFFEKRKIWKVFVDKRVSFAQILTIVSKDLNDV